MEMQNRRPRAGGGLQLGGSNGGQEEGGRQNATGVRQRQEDHVIIRALRKMKLVGLRQALKEGTSWLESLFWVGVFCVCMWITVYLTWISVEEYLENPTSNTFHDDANINFAPFPGVTVTGTMTFKSSGIDAAYEQYVDYVHKESREMDTNGSWTKEGVKRLLFTVDHFCEMVASFASRFSFLDLTKTVGLKQMLDWVRMQNVTIRDDPNDSIMRDQVMPFIRDNTLNCKSILLACMWEGSKENCEDLFVPVLTDVGVGCSFNRIPEDILRSSNGLMSLLQNRTKQISKDERSDWTKWNMDVDLKSAIERLKSPRKFPRNQNAAGNMKGLSLLMLHDEVEKFSCPVMSSSGFLIAIHSPFEEPQMMRSAVAVPPGYEVFIKVKGELTIADKTLQSIPIEKRNCIFQGETKLKQFSTYTLANCQRECLSRRIFSKCACHQLSMSSGKNENICGPLEIECVKNATRDLDQDGYKQLCGDLKCLAPCNDIKYETSVSYLPYHNKSIFDFSQNDTLNLRIRPNARTSIAHITFGSNSLTTRERKLLLRLAFLVGIIGGILGMTLEFTIASAFNVVAGLGVLVAPVFNIRRCRRVCSRYNDVEVGSQRPQIEASSSIADAVGNDSEREESENNFEDALDEEAFEEGFDNRLTNLRETMLQGLKETLLEDLRKPVLKNFRKTLLTDLRKDLIKDLNKTLTTDLKKTLTKDLKKTLTTDLKKTLTTDLKKTLTTEIKKTLTTDLTTLTTNLKKTLTTDLKKPLTTEIKKMKKDLKKQTKDFKKLTKEMKTLAKDLKETLSKDHNEAWFRYNSREEEFHGDNCTEIERQRNKNDIQDGSGTDRAYESRVIHDATSSDISSTKLDPGKGVPSRYNDSFDFDIETT